MLDIMTNTDQIGSMAQFGNIPRLSSPPGILLAFLGLLLLSYLAYRRALPKPLPGIPYNKAAAASILGDLPELWGQLRTRDLRAWFGSLARRLDSPIVQIFGRPSLGLRQRAQRPTLIVSDFRTAQDILLRRTKEFDRPPHHVAVLRGVIPHHHIAMLTSDPQFRRNKELVKDLMTPNFLHTVNAPEIWRNAVLFVDLWRLKARIAGGRPFDATEDVSRMTFDIIKNVAIGKGENTMIGVYLEQIQSAYDEGRLRSGDGEREIDETDAPFLFPKPPHDETLEAQYRMNKALSLMVPVPPALYHAINNRRPYMREAYASKEKLLRRQVDLAVKRMEAGEALQSALDYMIQREIGAARKEQRSPVFDSPYMFDELYGYLGAGHDTTATTFQWGMKHLAQHPDVQRKARENLRAVYHEAHTQGRPPSVTEIIKKQVPYLEAVMEEILRLSGPVGVTARATTVDTVIMGRHVPKGTQVFLAIFGPGLTSASIQDTTYGGGDVDAAAAAAAAAAADDKIPHSYTKQDNWDGMDPESFLPERWLAKDDKGNVVYDPQAGPILSFSLGIRGCFGRRLAYLTLRMFFTMLLWNFELGPVPEELDSWKAVQILTRKPVQCYVRLADIRE